MVQYMCKEKKLKKSNGLKGESHMSASKTKEINDLNDFQEGIFKIERNGKIITLTKEEIEQFKFLDTALKGREELMADNIFILQENGPNSKAMEIVWDSPELCFDIQTRYEQELDCPELEKKFLPRRIEVYKKFFSKD